MKKTEWQESVKKLRAVFPDSISSNLETEGAWYEIVAEISHGAVEKAVKVIVQETEFIRPGTNIGALVRNKVCPMTTSATIENHLSMALNLSRCSRFCLCISPLLVCC